MDTARSIAYFSMEIGLEVGMPTYSGGLGVLAGDTIRSAADLTIPLLAVTLLHRKGYFYQRLNGSGWQHEEPAAWVVEDFLHDDLSALNLSHYVNGVAKKHGEVSQHMFARYTIDAITNGVHAPTWTAQPFHALFDRYIAGWREDNFSLRYALSIPPEEMWDAHMMMKRQLIQLVNRTTNAGMDVDVLTLGFARRATAYKRPDLLFHDIERLRRIATQAGPLQVIYAGKAHPRDQRGIELIKRIHDIKDALKNEIKITHLTNYDLALGRLLTASVDVWLNTPQPPMEASGTSGMKAALNGVPSFSILDGWWIEGCIEGVTGWAIGTDHREIESHDDRAQDATALYDTLEQVIVPQFYKDRSRFVNVMRHAIAINGSFFNTQRMMQQYVVKAYFR